VHFAETVHLLFNHNQKGAKARRDRK